jgi:LuxR family maltose regulon positive regulatory protein
MREINDIMLQRPRLGVLVDEVSELRQLLTASTQGAAGGSPLSPAKLRLLPYLETHLTYREIAERLFVSRNTVSTEVNAPHRSVYSAVDGVEPGASRRSSPTPVSEAVLSQLSARR